MAPTIVHEIPSPQPDNAAIATGPPRAWIGHVLWWLMLAVPVTLALVAVAQPS